MELEERQRSILNAAVLEYIRTARPVASRELAREFGLRISPATIRNELVELDQQGFLEQPHTSAGRIPTDKGYRFFVDNLADDEELGSDEERMIRQVFAIREQDEFVRELAKAISRISRAFAAAGIAEGDLFCESGFSEILQEPEFADVARVRAFGRLADFLNEGLAEILPLAEEDRIWIGEENPWEEARQCSLLLSRWEHPAGFSGFISIIAPTRTDYSKHKAVISRLGTHHDG